MAGSALRLLDILSKEMLKTSAGRDFDIIFAVKPKRKRDDLRFKYSDVGDFYRVHDNQLDYQPCFKLKI